MKKYLKNLVIPGLAYLFFMSFSGCDTTTTVEASDDPLQTLRPVGQIHGHVMNDITDKPISGAVITVSFDGQTWRTVSDGTGYFSIVEVPVGDYQTVNGQAVATGTYIMTASFVDHNSKQSDSSMMYRDYYYRTVNVIFTTVEKDGDSLAVEDMVARVDYNISYLNTSVLGYVVDEENQPVADAIVFLYDAEVAPKKLLRQTTTGANGLYRFDWVDQGHLIDFEAVSSDWSLEADLPVNYQLEANRNWFLLRSEVANERLELAPADDHDPYVAMITPEMNQDADPSGFTVVYTFSEPIKQTPYTRTDLGEGHSTLIDDITFTYDGLKKINGEIMFTAAWNSDYTALTLTPSDQMTSGKYTCDMTTVLGKLMDIADRALVDNAAIQGDLSEALKFTINGNSTMPAAVNLNSYGNVDYNGGTVTLDWRSYNDANVHSFNIYRSEDGAPFELIQQNYTQKIITDALTNMVYPDIATQNDPLRTINYRYKVHPVSMDLVEGSASNIRTIRDNVQPRFTAGSRVMNAANDYTYTLSFSEPLSYSTATNISNFNWTDVGGITVNKQSIEYLGFTGATYDVRIRITNNGVFPGTYRVVVSNVSDLYGNVIDPDNDEIQGIF